MFLYDPKSYYNSGSMHKDKNLQQSCPISEDDLYYSPVRFVKMTYITVLSD